MPVITQDNPASGYTSKESNQAQIIDAKKKPKLIAGNIQQKKGLSHKAISHVRSSPRLDIVNNNNNDS